MQTLLIVLVAVLLVIAATAALSAGRRTPPTETQREAVHTIDVTITPAVMPLDRGVFEDAIVAELGGTADIVGGGTLLGDPPVSDFTIDTRSALGASELAAIVWRVLGSVSLTLPTVFTVRIDGVDHPRPTT